MNRRPPGIQEGVTMSTKKQTSELTAIELAAIDLSITALQKAGHTLGGPTESSSNPHEMMAEAVADAHHPFVELTERDREIIAQIKDLAGQLSSRTSLADLVEARARVVTAGQ
ncbi:hypothetical protein G3I13_20210 [Streptomyces sp. SID6673]|nr:hypothetical protein [Streptomyces sp. SID11726]NEB26663.1 hypothetical protein [Streptomyces sp. SID6673]